MSLASLINRRCQVVRRLPGTDTDPYGRQIPREEIVDTLCEFQRVVRRTVDEEAGGYGELSDTLWQVFFLPGFELRTGDALIVDGISYELVSDPWEARNPRTRQVTHIEAVVRRTAGSEDQD